MNLDKDRRADPMLDIPELLQSARFSILRASRAADLRDLVVQLKVACEAARVSALLNIRPGPRWQVRIDGDADRNCSFARLFAALRRTQAEVKRRDQSPSLPTAATSKKIRQPAQLQPVSRGVVKIRATLG